MLFFNYAGSIDEVDNVVHITWVQPRVLDLNQVKCMTVVAMHCGSIAVLRHGVVILSVSRKLRCCIHEKTQNVSILYLLYKD